MCRRVVRREGLIEFYGGVHSEPLTGHSILSHGCPTKVPNEKPGLDLLGLFWLWIGAAIFLKNWYSFLACFVPPTGLDTMRMRALINHQKKTHHQGGFLGGVNP